MSQPLIRARTALLVVLGLVVVALVVVSTIHPYAAWPAQDPGYYGFADQRALLQTLNFWNVLSNAPFLPVGLLGLWACARRCDGWRPGERAAYVIVFTGVALTALGSSYFHYRPSADTLFWDRLPMTLVFTAMFAIVLAGAVDERALRLGLWPLVGVGVATVVYWRHTELLGHGELRPYLLVQFVPMVAIPLLLVLRRPPATPTYVAVIALYTAAKVFEVCDAKVYALTGGALSGHSVKHVLGAAAIFPLYRLISRGRSD